LNNLEALLENWRTERIPETIADRTRRIYDLMARVYPVSSRLFHAKAHGVAVAMSGIRDGTNVLEIATGSGEMFSRIAAANPRGLNVGIDLSASMAAVTQERTRKRHPGVRCGLKAVDARQMPFRDGSFDTVVCCYLLELLANNDIVRALHEVHRVLKPGGRMVVILICHQRTYFNYAYRMASKLAPAFWGQQVDERRMGLIFENCGFLVREEKRVTQTLYPSRVLLVERR
jgi:ubiquinone/menaquinone biosynthesis C-methylase UbiE